MTQEGLQDLASLGIFLMQRFIGIITCSCDKLASMMFYKREGKGKVSCTLIRTGHRHSEQKAKVTRDE
jgi:hypothetical protein